MDPHASFSEAGSASASASGSHQSGKLDPDPDLSGKLDPDPHQSEKQAPDPHQFKVKRGIRIRIAVKRWKL
jgi:hypothetical protein